MLSSLDRRFIRNKVIIAFTMNCALVIGPGLSAVQRLGNVGDAAVEPMSPSSTAAKR